MGKSRAQSLLTLALILIFAAPVFAGWVEVRANAAGITVKAESISFQEVLTAVFKELNARTNTEETFDVPEEIGRKNITVDFATDTRLELFAKLQEIGNCRMERTENKASHYSFLPVKVKDPFKTEIGMPR